MTTSTARAGAARPGREDARPTSCAMPGESDQRLARDVVDGSFVTATLSSNPSAVELARIEGNRDGSDPLRLRLSPFKVPQATPHDHSSQILQDRGNSSRLSSTYHSLSPQISWPLRKDGEIYTLYKASILFYSFQGKQKDNTRRKEKREEQTT